MIPARLLVIDAHLEMRLLLQDSFEQQGYTVVTVASATEGYQAKARMNPDLIILDPDLPDITGLSAYRALTKQTPTPIIILSADSTECSKVSLLDAGASDYIVKPFSPAELTARVRVQLRARSTNTPPPIWIDNLCIDLHRRIVMRDGMVIHLTRTEWAVLTVLTESFSHVVSHEDLIAAVWGNYDASRLESLHAYIKLIRRKLCLSTKDSQILVTISGVGYCLQHALQRDLAVSSHLKGTPVSLESYKN